jgi:hypothetical protein
LQTEITVQTLFETSTVVELAAIIEQKQAELIERADGEELSQILMALDELSEEEIRTMLNS